MEGNLGLQIVVIYLLTGIPVSIASSIAVNLAKKEPLKAAFSLKSIVFYLITFMFWPYFAWAIFRRECLHATYCAHCGKTTYGKGEMRRHMYTCELNPVVVELNKLKENVIAFTGQLEAWGYSASAQEIIDEVLGDKVEAPDYYAMKDESKKLHAEIEGLKRELESSESFGGRQYEHRIRAEQERNEAVTLAEELRTKLQLVEAAMMKIDVAVIKRDTPLTIIAEINHITRGYFEKTQKWEDVDD